MKTWRFVCIFLFLLYPSTPSAADDGAGAELLKLTDREGRQMHAEILRASLEQVWIRRDDGRTFRVPISRFNDDGQERIAEWRTLEDLRRLGLDLSARRYRRDRETVRRGSEVSHREESGYEITIKNNLNTSLADLRAEYRVYKRHGGYEVNEQNRRLSRIVGTHSIEEIPARSETAFSTGSMNLNLDRGNRWTGVSYQNLYPDNLAGIWVRIFLGDVQVAEMATPGDLMDREKWESE